MLPLAAGNDLGPGEQVRVRGHLEGCPSCRTEYEKYLMVINLWRGEYSEISGLDSARRQAVLVAAGERGGLFRALAGRVGAWIDLSLPTLTRPGALAAAAAALVALIALPVARREVAPVHENGEPMTIEVVAADGSVRLAWRDGDKGSYTVYKSDDPRDFDRGEAHQVRGNVWIDSAPESSSVVFYKIE